MNENDIEPVRMPDELITITPGGPDALQFAYQRSPDGVDLTALVVDDRRIGAVRSLYTLDAAQVIVATMAAMVADIDRLRNEWRIGGLGDA